ncbi:Arginyl-tRNA synthetase [Aphelenchoides fujianensis]|nr:Arginyl-tRNA synthetase [Aphelenchoides fujianensis]
MILYLRRLARGGGLLGEILKRKVAERKLMVVDYSSPNIAKHFHIGNLRSTLVGEFFCKINRLAGHEVKTVNYLGDWGTQFALLAAYWPQSEARREYEQMAADSTVRERLVPLMKGYVEASQHVEKNPAFRSEVANEHLARMEEALIAGRTDDPALRLWSEFRQLSCEYLTQFYAELGISFDHWDAESVHVPAARRLVDRLVDSPAASRTSTGLWIVRNETTSTYSVLRRTNKSTLEVACALARDDRFHADSYVYIVDLAQTSHFQHLKHLLEVVGRKDLAEKIVHQQFGRVIGMSTRRQRVELVEEVLADGVQRAEKFVRKSPTMKVPEEEIPEVCRELAEAALFLNEFKRNKASNYTFFVKDALNPKTRPFFLHEKYARLCSVIENNPDLNDELRGRLDSEMSPLGLETDGISRGLTQCLYEMDGALFTSYSTAEASALFNYMNRLATSPIRDEPDRNVALNRLLLLTAARNVMGECLELFGLKPLKRI